MTVSSGVYADFVKRYLSMEDGDVYLMTRSQVRNAILLYHGEQVRGFVLVLFIVGGIGFLIGLVGHSVLSIISGISAFIGLWLLSVMSVSYEFRELKRKTLSDIKQDEFVNAVALNQYTGKTGRFVLLWIGSFGSV